MEQIDHDQWTPMVGEKVKLIYFGNWWSGDITRGPDEEFTGWKVQLDCGFPFEVCVWLITNLMPLEASRS